MALTCLTNFSLWSIVIKRVSLFRKSLHNLPYNTFSIFYLAAPWPTLCHCRWDSLTYMMLISTFLFQFQPEGHWEPRNEVWTEYLLILLQRFNLRSHCPYDWLVGELQLFYEISDLNSLVWQTTLISTI